MTRANIRIFDPDRIGPLQISCTDLPTLGFVGPDVVLQFSGVNLQIRWDADQVQILGRRLLECSDEIERRAGA